MKRSRSVLKHLRYAGIKGKKKNNKENTHVLKNNHTSNRKVKYKSYPLHLSAILNLGGLYFSVLFFL